MEGSGYYKNAGVDVNAGYESNELIKNHVEKTFNNNVLGKLGSFAGMFSLKEASNMQEPVLAAGTDGVGTKLKIAFLMDKHDTVGIDCVAMCVNDIVCCGAKPIVFLDYFACGKNYPQKTEMVVKGIVDGCVLAGAALIGGETAEMPGFYNDGEYDLAGFSVGMVERSDVIDGSKAVAGDKIIGIASSGLHSNGFSLVRKVFSIEDDRTVLDEYYTELSKTLGEELLTPTKIYVNTVLTAVQTGHIKAIANITGGGFYENIPRAYSGLKAVIKSGSWPRLPIFELIMKKGNIPENEMYGIYNMGIGMVMIVSPGLEEEVIKAIESCGEKAYVIGEMAASDGRDIEIC